MLLRIHEHIAHREPEDACSAPHCISHQKFAMTLVEQLVCGSCGATTEPMSFTQVNHTHKPKFNYYYQHVLQSISIHLGMHAYGNITKDRLIDISQTNAGYGVFNTPYSCCYHYKELSRNLLNKMFCRWCSMSPHLR